MRRQIVCGYANGVVSSFSFIYGRTRTGRAFPDRDVNGLLTRLDSNNLAFRLSDE